MKRKNSEEFDSSDDERFLKRAEVENTLHFSELEKRIIEKSLLMITKARNSDWNYERDEDRMSLHSYTMIEDILREILVEVSYVEEETNCRVLYRSDNGEYSVLFYKWDNDILNNEIRFVKLEEETFYLFFSRTIKKRLNIESYEKDTWFHFQDARSHLQGLSSR